MVEKTLTLNISEQDDAWIKEQIATGDFPDEATVFADSITIHQTYNDLVDQITQSGEGWAQRQDDLAQSVIESQSANGAIIIKMSCDFQLYEVMIDPAQNVPTDPLELETAIGEAIRNVLQEVHLVRDHTENPDQIF